MTIEADPATGAESDRAHRRRWVMGGAALALLLVASLGSWWSRHPDVSFENGYGIGMTRDVGFTVWAPLGDSDQPGGSPTFTGLEPIFHQDGAEVRVEYLLCELDPVVLEEDRVGGFGYGLSTRDLRRYCRITRPALGAELEMRTDVRHELLAGITATRPGRTVITGHRVSYRVGWQRGSSDIGVSTRLTARPGA